MSFPHPIEINWTRLFASKNKQTLVLGGLCRNTRNHKYCKNCKYREHIRMFEINPYKVGKKVEELFLKTLAFTQKKHIHTHTYIHTQSHIHTHKKT